MAETWCADLDHADEIGVDQRDIARGAILFVLRRGLSTWCRRRWCSAALLLIALFVSAVVPAWLLVPGVACGLLAWVIAAPTHAAVERHASRSVH